MIAMLVIGCSRPTSGPEQSDESTAASKAPVAVPKQAARLEPQDVLTEDCSFPAFASSAKSDSLAVANDPNGDDDESENREMLETATNRPPLRPIDDARAASAGIRKLTGKRLTLYTDVAPSPAVEELPQVFDAAFAQWCDLFGIDATQHGDWQMRGFLITDRARFEAVGLCPAEIPQFLNGYTRGHEFWWYNQASDYYRRHLMLHEGTHGIMFTLQESGGSAWYMEGIAELAATHRWENERLALAHFPASPEEVSKLGRIETVRRDLEKESGFSLRQVLDLRNAAFSKVEPYAWTWATAAFLYEHPRYRERFRRLMRSRAGDKFNDKLREAYAEDSRELAIEWQVFIADLAHGYGFARTQVDLSDGKPLTEGKLASVTIAADRGWQNTGVLVEAGKQYKLSASGRYQLAAKPKPWISEPGGVTIRYHRGLPLGTLVAVINSEEAAGGTSLVKPDVIGTGTTLVPKATGTLFLKINDSPGELADNEGSASVVIATAIDSQ